jgi:hypothetical protein
MRQDGGTGEVVQLVENEDYYLDAGLMVLTAHDHLRRGYCCEASPQKSRVALGNSQYSK